MLYEEEYVGDTVHSAREIAGFGIKHLSNFDFNVIVIMLPHDNENKDGV